MTFIHVLRTCIKGHQLNLPAKSPQIYPQKLTRAGNYLAKLLEENSTPVLTQFDFFHIIWRMYKKSSATKLYLRHNTPSRKDYFRLRLSLMQNSVINSDPDYNERAIRGRPSQTFQRKTLSASSIQHATSPISLLCSDGGSAIGARMPGANAS